MRDDVEVIEGAVFYLDFWLKRDTQLRTERLVPCDIIVEKLRFLILLQ